ncbi:LacI family DNA-binding transcriptional regulator [Terrarubrum flagellatum]|uniref:LacI family DNA-binding transcriptional regulator n=1 Tax=Terrirubrum flagellatum TaxID=2895980 RepID=UPI00314525E0
MKEKATTPRGEAPTISRVAAEAGVSRATVSRAFTRPEILSPQTVARVQEVAAQLGYTPNQVARALSTGRHGNFALIVPDVANPFFPPLIRAAQKRADQSDFCLFLGNSDEDPDLEDKLLGRFLGQVEGVVLASSRLDDAQIRRHAERKPLVLINRDVAGIPRVLIDSASGVRAAVEHLAGLGHRHIVYVSGPAASWSNRQRRQALRQACTAAKLTASAVAAQRPTFEAGLKSAKAVAATGATAAVAFDEVVAQGLLAGLSGIGIDVPGRFSVVGCDDVIGATTSPPMTTVSNRSAEAGEAAMALLLDVLRTRAIRDVRYVLDTHLVVRGSTGRAPGRSKSS